MLQSRSLKMATNTHIHQTCEGFNTKDACGQCTVSMDARNLHYMSLAQVTNLLIDITCKVASGEFPIISSFSDCVTGCTPGSVRYLDDAGASDFASYMDLAVTAVTFWRLIPDKSKLDELPAEEQYEVFIRREFTNRLRNVEDMNELIKCLRDINTCVREQKLP